MGPQGRMLIGQTIPGLIPQPNSHWTDPRFLKDHLHSSLGGPMERTVSFVIIEIFIIFQYCERKALNKKM